MRKPYVALVTSATVAVLGCGSSDGSNPGSSAFQELYDQGLTKYVDEFDPIETVEEPDGVATYVFEVPDDPAADPRGPLCLRGAGYNVQMRGASGDELVIFLQGGGACWEDFCEASTEPQALPEPGSDAGILDPLFPDNPVGDWDFASIPYCDGSLFAGDVDRILPPSVTEGGEPSIGYQRGLQNLTAALDVTVEAFPAPSRILLTGISAGGFGTIAALPLVRFYYPNTDVIVFNDSGVGVVNGDDPSFLNDTLIDGWNARETVVPDSCSDCFADGHATRLVQWQLDADPTVTMSALSFSQDAVVADFFFELGGPLFQEQLLEQTALTAELFPERYKRFIPDGTQHTALALPMTTPIGPLSIGGLDQTIDGTNVLEFLTAHIDDSEAWVNLVDEGLEEP